MSDLISVIIPVYKVEQYLDACLSSVVSQTHQNLEIILIDDGSPDRCPAMCDEWAQKDCRIRVLHKANGGAAAARNAGLDIAQGKYIGFVDSDDMIRPDMYEILLNAIYTTQKKVACCYGGWEPDKSYESKNPKIRVANAEETVMDVLTGRVGTSLWRRLYHRSVWDHLRLPEGEINEDYPVLIPSIVAADGMVEVKEPLYYYRRTPTSVTATYWNNTNVVLKNMERMRNQIEEYKLNCLPQFRDFAIRSVYFNGILLDKHLQDLNDTGKRDHRTHLQLMRKFFFAAMLGKALKAKDKVLYCMIVMRVLRPVYKSIGRL